MLKNAAQMTGKVMNKRPSNPATGRQGRAEEKKKKKNHTHPYKWQMDLANIAGTSPGTKMGGSQKVAHPTINHSKQSGGWKREARNGKGTSEITAQAMPPTQQIVVPRKVAK